MESELFLNLKALTWQQAYNNAVQKGTTAEQARIDATNALEVFIKAVKEEHA